jgi:hypothetical protein
VLDGNAGWGNGVGSSYNAAVSLDQGATAQAPAEIFDGAGSKGSDALSQIKWGRWESGFAFETTGAHYVSDFKVDRAVVLPAEGTLEYNLSGGTAPTDNQGNVGTLDAGKLVADFTNQTVINEIHITINGDTWRARGNGKIDSGAPVFDGVYDIQRGSGAVGYGSYSGFFGGAPLNSGAYNGAPSGAGIGYSLKSEGIWVDGAAAFSTKPN